MKKCSCSETDCPFEALSAADWTCPSTPSSGTFSRLGIIPGRGDGYIALLGQLPLLRLSANWTCPSTPAGETVCRLDVSLNSL